MDCDCELLHNEPPSIPVYHLFSLFSRHLLASAPFSVRTHIYTIMYACMRRRRCTYTCRWRDVEDANLSAQRRTLRPPCRMVSWPAGVSSGLVLISSSLLLQLIHSLSVTAVACFKRLCRGSHLNNMCMLFQPMWKKSKLKMKLRSHSVILPPD